MPGFCPAKNKETPTRRRPRPHGILDRLVENAHRIEMRGESDASNRRLWPGWTNCLPLTGKLDAKELVSLGVTLCVRKEPSLCWMISVARSKHSTVRCIALQCAQQGLPIRARTVEETYSISG